MTAQSPFVGFLGLSGYERDDQVIERARHYFASRGYGVRMLPEADAAILRFAGPIETRLDALYTLVDDVSIRLILGLRGGYGLSQLLPQIDFERIGRAIDARGLMFCGFSDFTAFCLALYARTGRGVLTGPSAVMFGQDKLDRFTEDCFWRAVEGNYMPLEFPSDGPACDAAGPLWGGNLSMLVSLLGTPWFPEVDGGILFVEEVNEHPYRIERMLLQLDYAGVLRRQNALVIGQVTNYRLSEYDAGYDMAHVIAEIRRRLACPVITGLPFGHVAHQASLPIGAHATLELASGHARLACAAMSAANAIALA